MFDRIKTLLHRWRDLREVSELSDREIADLGLTRGQIEDFLRMPPEVPDRVAAMARIFGLTDEQLRQDHDRYHAILSTCSQCRDQRACRLLLDRGDFARPEDASFCLNHDTFAANAA